MAIGRRTKDYDLNAELIEVRKSPAGSSLTAVIGVKGQIVIATGPNGVNAQVEFAFEDPAAAPPAAVPPAEEAAKEQPAGRETPKARTTPGLIEARGHISKIRLAHEFTVPLPGNDGRFKQTNHTRDCPLERRTENQADGAGRGSFERSRHSPTPTIGELLAELRR